ncbi:MAG: NAD-dependent protein deacylase [Erysipelotrichia bacterium]|nr:NAD-dependent protein deacylase [Erysipelotrichia bacterium]NCC54866.1 NAD-dependent protein deacylase [Erysipelotrichia bacterium]
MEKQVVKQVKVKMKQIESLIKKANRIVVFSGAGFSTESDIPDFRSEQGIYRKKTYPYPCEMMISHDFFMRDTKQFYEFYKNEMVYANAKANKGHLAVAKLERLGKLEAVITQNIDGLHQLAGNQKVYELHGSIHRNYCMDCHTFYSLDKIMQSKEVPHCDKCGGVIKPDVVLYQEGLDQNVVNQALLALQRADLLIVAGTSLLVYPAASFIQYYRGENMIVINHDETSADKQATVVSHDNIGDVLDFINTNM